MNRLYWRPAGPSRRALSLVALLAVALLVLVESLPLNFKQEAYDQKLEASKRAHQSFVALKKERERLGIQPTPSSDPGNTGMVGATATEVTTATGSLPSKRTTINPNFAAVIVEYFHQLGLQKGDVVAVGYSGSFPAMNAVVLAAIETMELVPLVIASATASDFGASYPRFMWLDMEATLRKAGLTEAKALSASIGGIEDQGIGLSKGGLALVRDAMKRNGVPYLEPRDFLDSLEKRMRLYEKAAEGRAIRAYVNVGGGAVSVGRSRGKSLFKAGINRPGPTVMRDSIMGRFLQKGVPAIHLVRIKSIAERWGLPIDPQIMPPVGQGGIFLHQEPNRWLAAASLLLLLGVLAYVGRRARARAHLQTVPEDVTWEEKREKPQSFVALPPEAFPDSEPGGVPPGAADDIQTSAPALPPDRLE